MAYTDDWENLMNGVFGPGGKLRFDTQKTPPEKPGLPDMNAALLEQQKKLDEMLKKQNAELRRDTTQEALAQSRKMLEDMEADGLLAKGTTEVKQEHLGSFEGLAAEVKKTVLGQDAFVDGVVRYVIRSVGIGVELLGPEAIPLSELHPESNGAVVAVLIPTIFRKSRRFIA